MGDMKMKKVYIATFCSLLLLSCGEERESYSVGKEDIVESVYSSVVVEPAEMYEVNALNSGYIDQLMVSYGDTVSEGSVLFLVRDVQSNATASNSKLALELARSKYKGDVSLLDDLELELDDARLKRKNDSINYFRNKELFEKKLLTEFELEQSELQYATAKTRSRLLANQLARAKADLKSSLDQAVNNYSSSLSRSKDAVVRNRINGQVYDVFKEEGEYVSMQQPVLIVGSNDRFSIKMKIDEVDITRIKIGQRIKVSLEAYKNQVFEAKVTRISPKMNVQIQTFEVEGEFVEVPSQLYMGLTGEGNIIVNQRENVLIIPLEYLIDGKYVLTESGNVRVKTGAKSLSHVEVVSGIKAGTIIYKKEE